MFKNFLNFIVIFLTVLDLPCCEWAFSSCDDQDSHSGGFLLWSMDFRVCGL